MPPFLFHPHNSRPEAFVKDKSNHLSGPFCPQFPRPTSLRKQGTDSDFLPVSPPVAVPQRCPRGRLNPPTPTMRVLLPSQSAMAPWFRCCASLHTLSSTAVR